jgi:hypothetical protein
VRNKLRGLSSYWAHVTNFFDHSDFTFFSLIVLLDWLLNWGLYLWNNFFLRSRHILKSPDF